MACVLAERIAVLPCWRRVDVWEELHPGDPGLTYDPKANPMLGDPPISSLHACCDLPPWVPFAKCGSSAQQSCSFVCALQP